METAVKNEVWDLCVGVQQVGRPLSDASIIDQQVIADDHVLRQGVVQFHIDQMDKGLAAYRHDLAVVLVQRDVPGLSSDLQP
jgi:hypothetical protein